MQHLKVSATIASLGLLVSCSSPPPSHAPTRSRAVAAGERGILAACLPYDVAYSQAPLLGAASPQQRLKLALQLPLRNQAGDRGRDLEVLHRCLLVVKQQDASLDSV